MEMNQMLKTERHLSCQRRNSICRFNDTWRLLWGVIWYTGLFFLFDYKCKHSFYKKRTVWLRDAISFAHKRRTSLKEKSAEYIHQTNSKSVPKQNNYNRLLLSRKEFKLNFIHSPQCTFGKSLMIQSPFGKWDSRNLGCCSCTPL